ncbi:MAG: nodulation protein NfeD, partial [Cytophagales bacterium]
MKNRLLSLIAVLILFSVFNISKAENERILKVQLKANIDPRTNRLIELALEKAESDSMDAVIIEMDTYGGAVTDANDIRNAILEYDKPIHVFINT